MQQRTLKGGIAGCGKAASLYHMPAFRAMKGVEIVAVCDINKDTAAGTAGRFRIPNYYEDVTRMLKEEKLDFVDICTPPQEHFRAVVEALDAGVHVLVEKPMAISVAEADEMISVSRKFGGKLCVVHNYLFNPVIKKAKSLVDSGAIGDLISVEGKVLAKVKGAISNKYHWGHKIPGGLFGEYSAHQIYLATAFLGKINSVQAAVIKHSSNPWVIADEYRVTLRTDKHLGSITVSCNSPIPANNTIILGTRRNLNINNYTYSMVQHTSGTYKILDLIYDDLNSSFQIAKANICNLAAAVFGRRWYGAGHRVIIREFLDSIRNDTEPPVTGEDGRETIRIMEDIFRQVNI